MELWRDGAIGEAREALSQDGRVIALRVLRASEARAHARWGEVYAARIARIEARLRGAFVDLGLNEEQGFLALDQRGRAHRQGMATSIVEGQRLVVRIVREAARGKGPVVELIDADHPGGASQRLERSEADAELAACGPASPQRRAQIDAAIDEALARTAPIQGGGALLIEPTAALVAIDVDAGARQGSRDPETFALDLNLMALEEAARQIRLRSLGGLIAIDFVSMRLHQSRTRLLNAVKEAFVRDPASVQVGGLSRFGVLELARAQLMRPLHEVFQDSHGRVSVETIALAALRAVEREAIAYGGRRIGVVVSEEVHAWLNKTNLDWRSGLSGRIGMRFELAARPGVAREFIDVRAL